ncbi:MAG: HDOD domain protein [Syntrophorhabdus sp. PtaU1.Bin153]|nr:MAG: HDOD domain protein [Syntrophorhabdus sp. PtaU1.Bin153]
MMTIGSMQAAVPGQRGLRTLRISPCPLGHRRKYVRQVTEKTSDSTIQIKLKGFSEKETIALYQIGKVREVGVGEYLVREGQIPNNFYLVLDGSFVAMKDNGNEDLVVLRVHKGACFGNIDITEDARNSFSVSAAEPSRVLEIDQYALNLLPPETQTSAYRKINRFSVEIVRELSEKTVTLFRKVKYLVAEANASQGNGKADYARSRMVQDMIKDFPRLPVQISKLTSILLDEGASVTEIVTFAKMDPSVVSVVLKTVNSGYYRFQRKISDFHHAFLLLGFNQVYGILMENFLEGILPRHVNLKGLNLHSAIISQMAFDISQLSNKSKPVMMSTLGILHDMGKCVMLLSKSRKPELDLAYDKLDGGKIGSLLLDTWNTPEIICRTVEYQSYPRFAPPEEVPSSYREAVAILHLAHICYDYLGGVAEEDALRAFSDEYMDLLNLENKSIPDLMKVHILPSLSKKIDVFPDHVREFILKNASM